MLWRVRGPVGKTSKDESRRKIEKRLAWLGRAIALGLIAGLLLSPNLWISDRAYPLVPLLDLVPPLPPPVDRLFFGLLVALLVGSVVAWGRGAGSFAVAAVGLTAFLVLEDQSRLQPWVYQYSFMLVAVGLWRLGRISTENALNASRVIIAGTYLWSGLQKANASFIDDAYRWLVEPLTTRLPAQVESGLLLGAYAVPAIEAALGIGLLTRRLRGPAVIGALLMHTFILFSIGPWGHNWNTVVWPWNIAMAAFVLILFWRTPDAPSPLSILNPRRSILRAVVLVLFAVMPLFSFFGLWDSYLSASLYSGNIKEAYISVQDGSRQARTSINDLSMKEMNVPAYPEERIFKSVFAWWCEGAGFSEPTLRVLENPEIFSGERQTNTYRCDEV